NSDDSDSKDTQVSADAADANKLDGVSKLGGRRIGVVTGNAATREVLDVVLSHYGVPLNQVQVSLIDPSHIAEAVKAREVDVLFVAGAETGQAINDVVAAATVNGQAPSFIPIDQAEGMAKRSPAFQSIDIEAGTFGGNPPEPPDDLKSLSFPEYLVAKKSFHHDAIGTLAKLIFTSRLALAAAMPGEIKIKAPGTEKDANVVVHPGALAYLNDDQKTFFDRYGDDIFYGLLIFPIFGSAIAAVASYFRNNGRSRRLRLLQRLLDLTQKANHAPSLEALDKLQADVDHLVVAIIHQTEQEEYDQAVQTSFGLALDQVRFAIASRRAVLLEHGGAEAKFGAKAAAA
ncbi:MAG TPA: TAXI family TRAP transporter solute-binding subunit, partial [Pirellulales bacterium]|nr:TAXI family TRAP transporter solute-binding subunit [Pirellulales bacterium]